MGRMDRLLISDAIYFITCSTFQRKKFFSKPQYAKIVVDQWKHYEMIYEFRLHAYCVMSDHYHVLLDVGKTKSISEIMHAVNSYISTLLNKELGKTRKGKVFQSGFWDEIIRDEEMYWQKVSYILFNPYRAGIVKSPIDDYRFSNIREWIERESDEFVLDLFSRYRRWHE